MAEDPMIVNVGGQRYAMVTFDGMPVLWDGELVLWSLGAADADERARTEVIIGGVVVLAMVVLATHSLEDLMQFGSETSLVALVALLLRRLREERQDDG